MTSTKKKNAITPAEAVDYSIYYDLLTKRRAALLEIEQRDREQIEQRQITGDSPGDIGDVGTIDVNSDYYLNRADHDRSELIQIRDALERIHHGTYGKCGKCKEPIAPERLNRLPYAHYCVECQNDRETREKVYHLHFNPKI